jgi:hypothetical protein
MFRRKFHFSIMMRLRRYRRVRKDVIIVFHGRVAAIAFLHKVGILAVRFLLHTEPSREAPSAHPLCFIRETRNCFSVKATFWIWRVFGAARTQQWTRQKHLENGNDYWWIKTSYKFDIQKFFLTMYNMQDTIKLRKKQSDW